MADTPSNTPAPNPQNPYQDPQYRQNREAALGIIPKSNFLSAISRNAATIYSALAMTAVAAIVAGIVHVPLWGTITLIGGALAAAGVSAYAGYMDEKLSKTVGFDYGENRQIAEARINAKEMANALNETLGTEIKEIKKENYQTQQALVDLQQKIASWQEREAGKDEPSRSLQ